MRRRAGGAGSGVWHTRWDGMIGNSAGERCEPHSQRTVGARRTPTTPRGLGVSALLLALAASSLVVVAAVPAQPADAQRIEPEGARELGEFGDAVDIDGNLAIVGDTGDGEGGPRAGAATIFRRIGSDWTFDAKLLGAAGADGGFGFDVAISDGLAIGFEADTDTVSAGSSPFDSATCPSGTAITGFDVVRSSQSIEWPREFTLRCTPIVRDTSGNVVLDTALTTQGPIFNDPADDPTPPDFPSLPGSTRVECQPGSLIIGFSAQAGSLLDGFQFQCAPLSVDGLLGAFAGDAPAIGTSDALQGPNFCPAGFATGVAGRTGDDINAFRLTCSSLEVGDQTAYVGAPFDDFAGTDAGTV